MNSYYRTVLVTISLERKAVTMLLEQMIRFHVQTQALIFREVFSWPVAVLTMWDEMTDDHAQPPATITPIRTRSKAPPAAAA